RRLALQPRVVVHDAEHTPPVEAVAGQGRVAVDPLLAAGAAADELAHLAAAAAVPGAFHDRVEPVLLVRPLLADPGPRRTRLKLAVRAAEAVARAVDRPAVDIHGPAEVVDGMTVARPKGEAVLVDARETERVRARSCRPDVPAEVERLALLRAHSGRDCRAARRHEHGAAHPPQERAPRHPGGEPGRERPRRAVEETVRPAHVPSSRPRARRARRAARAS